MAIKIQNKQDVNNNSAPQGVAGYGQKKPYSSSKLNIYGDLRNLTQSGTKLGVENNGHPERRG